MRRLGGYRLLSRSHGPFNMGHFVSRSTGRAMLVSEGPLMAHIVGPDNGEGTEAKEKGKKAQNEQEHTSGPFIQFD